MERIDKLKLAIEKGYTYDAETGLVKGPRGKYITNKEGAGYTSIKMIHNGKSYMVKCHQLAYYVTYGKICVSIDHINGDKSDNRISNLREITIQKNTWNRKDVKGYTYRKDRNAFVARIIVDGKRIGLGHYKTEEEAYKAYVDAKKVYHII
jgi:hypothetical protein